MFWNRGNGKSLKKEDMHIWRGFDKKVSDQDEVRMVNWWKKGWPVARIAKKFKVSPASVKYHIDPKFRAKTIRRAADWMKEHGRRSTRQPYMSKYIITRYREDEEFRGRFLGAIKRYAHRIQDRNAKIKVESGTVVKCQYCHKKWALGVGHMPKNCRWCGFLQVRLPKKVGRVSR